MITVKVTCSVCDEDVELLPKQITLERVTWEGCSYSFVCPLGFCGGRSLNVTSRRIAENLIRAGANPNSITEAEIREFGEGLSRVGDVWKELDPGHSGSQKSP